MRCYNSTIRQQDETFLAMLKTQLSTAQATYLELLSSNVDMYRFDAGEGQQTVKDKSIEQMAHQIDILQRQINYYERKLNGCGVVNMALRRRIYR